MSTPAITVEALPAGYGDCLLVSCPMSRRTWRLLVDTGPDECLPSLAARLSAIAPDAQGNRCIDLAIISHIDHDHIGSAARLFADRSLKLKFDDIWFNAPRKPATRGVAEGVGLASVLGEAARDLPWNLAFGGQDVVTGDTPFIELPAKRGGPRITLLSPTRLTLDALFRIWAKELPNVKVRPEPEPIVADRGGIDVAALAARRTPEDGAPANGSSIAILLEHRGASLLLTADAFPGVLSAALEALARHRRIALPWPIDLLKLSHHGSRSNTTTRLMSTVLATHTLVCTNGAIFGHPDPEGIARAVLRRRNEAHLWFNYRTAKNSAWGAKALCDRYGYVAHYPGDSTPGVTIDLPGRQRVA